jgi:gluconolactonase
MSATGCFLLLALAVTAQDPQPFQIVKVAGGFRSADGPLWNPEGYLMATDPPAGRLLRLKAGVVPGTALETSAAGIAFDHRHRLILCDPVKRQVLRWDGKGRPEVLASQFEGKKLNSPNDVVTRGDLIFFTDPAFGSAAESRELPFHGVYRLTSKGELTVLAKWEKRPNGIALSPNGRILYVAASDERAVRAYDLDRSGMAANERLLITGIRGVPNGLAVDENGSIYVACEGVAIYSPEGKQLRFIEIGDPPTNLAFGDADYKSLYVSARSGVYRIRVEVRGAEAKE